MECFQEEKATWRFLSFRFFSFCFLLWIDLFVWHTFLREQIFSPCASSLEEFQRYLTGPKEKHSDWVEIQPFNFFKLYPQIVKKAKFHLSPVACLSWPEKAATSRRRWESRLGEEVLGNQCWYLVHREKINSKRQKICIVICLVFTLHRCVLVYLCTFVGNLFTWYRCVLVYLCTCEPV